jgi:hypothetical protein
MNHFSKTTSSWIALWIYWINTLDTASSATASACCDSLLSIFLDICAFSGLFSTVVLDLSRLRANLDSADYLFSIVLNFFSYLFLVCSFDLLSVYKIPPPPPSWSVSGLTDSVFLFFSSLFVSHLSAAFLFLLFLLIPSTYISWLNRYFVSLLISRLSCARSSVIKENSVITLFQS